MFIGVFYLSQFHGWNLNVCPLQGLGLDIDPSKPLVAVVSRLVDQKNPSLMREALHRTLEKGGQFVLLGTGDRNAGLVDLANSAEFKEHPNCRCVFYCVLVCWGYVCLAKVCQKCICVGAHKRIAVLVGIVTKCCCI